MIEVLLRNETEEMGDCYLIEMTCCWPLLFDQPIKALIQSVFGRNRKERSAKKYKYDFNVLSAKQ
jgi:hypothetical protein